MKRLGISILVLFMLVGLMFVFPGCAADETVDEEEPQEVEESAGFPEERINFVVGYDAGGGVDSSLRIQTEILQRELGVPVVVENEAGAGGRIATTNIFNEEPDGYTILVRELLSVVLGEVQYDVDFVANEFEPVAVYSDSGWMLSVGRDSPIASYEELIKELEQGEVTIGVVGRGTSGHLVSSVIFEHLGVLDNVRFVHHDGGNPAMADVAGGHIDAAITGVGGYMRGRDGARALASLSQERVSEEPDVKTIIELGYDGPFFTQIFGMLAPPGTPQERVSILEDAFRTASEDPGVQQSFEDMGLPLVFLSSEELRERLEDYVSVVNEFIDLVE